MEWIFQKVPLFVIFMIVYSIVKAVQKAREQRAEHEATNDESAEQRRVREIQERIRRIAADRQGGRVPADAPPVLRPTEPATMPPSRIPDFDPLGGPMKRVLGELERRLQPAPAAPPHVPVPMAPLDRAELERQERFAEELRVLEETKVLANRRAAQRAAEKREASQSEAAQRGAARERVLGDLHDPQSLRRAFVLREVLGPPVAMR